MIISPLNLRDKTNISYYITSCVQAKKNEKEHNNINYGDYRTSFLWVRK